MNVGVSRVSVFHHGFYQDVFSDIHAQCVDLKDQDIIELVDDETRQSVGIGKDDAAALRIDDALAIVPGVRKTLFKESLIDHIIFISAQYPDPDLGMIVDIAAADEIIFIGNDRYDIAVFIITFDMIDLIIKDPQSSGRDRTSFVFL